MLGTIDLYEKIRVSNNTIVLDCTNPSHRDLLFSLYGGKENMQNQLPKQYALFEKQKITLLPTQLTPLLMGLTTVSQLNLWLIK